VDKNRPVQIKVDLPQHVSGIAWSPIGTKLAMGITNGSIAVWDIRSLTEEKQLSLGSEDVVDHLAWSPDSSKIVVAARSGGVISIWDTSIWTQISDLSTLHIDFVGILEHALSWSPDGKEVAILKKDGVVVWDIKSNQVIATFTGKAGKIDDIAWSPDNSYIALATSLQGIVAISTKFVGSPCNWVSRNLTHDEWNTYVSSSIPYRVLCPDKPVPNQIQ
jgi:WD40 repeat protein